MGRAAGELDELTQYDRNRAACDRLLKALRRHHPDGPPADVAVQPARAGAARVAPLEASSGSSSSFAWL